MADVELGAHKGEDVIGATESDVRAALSGEDVDAAVVAPGAGTALGRQAAAGGVGAGLPFFLQGTEVTQQGVVAQSGEEQGSHG